MIRALQDYSFALWTDRNAILHENSEHSLSIVNAQLNADVSQMYSLRASLSDNLSTYFQILLADRLRQTPHQRHRWLHQKAVFVNYFL
jgi:recombinational DNA repair ATPase RecF